jgi:hypothetical protein
MSKCLALPIAGVYDHCRACGVFQPMSIVLNKNFGRVSSWCSILIVATVCSLAVNVMARYTGTFSAEVHPGKSSVLAIHSQVQKTQRLNKDATSGVSAPDSRVTVLQTPGFYPRFAPSDPSVHNLLLDQHLYNRPPPSSAFLA